MADLGAVTWVGGAAALALSVAGCGGPAEIIYLARTGCEACHRPVRPDGTPEGLEVAHPAVDGVPLTCVDCHGGDGAARKQSEAHVVPASDDPAGLRFLSPRELDQVDPELLRFVNPGDLRVASRSCGAGSDRADGGGGCHQDVVDRIKRSPMATLAGELDVTRYRAGSQPSPEAVVALYDVVASDRPGAAESPGTAQSLRAFDAATVSAGEQAVGPYQDELLAKRCLGCHLWSFGSNGYDGTFRSSGCTACHMVYDDSGLSSSGDPMLDKGATPHPARHELTVAIPTAQCAHCHHDGGRIGPSFQGYRERGLPGSDPPGATELGRPLYGHDGSFYLVDEGRLDGQDETPPDVHFEVGMHCVDCHVGVEVHGDGRIWTEGAGAVRVRCRHCHGTVAAKAMGEGDPGFFGEAMTRDEAGAVWLQGRVEERRWRIPQIADSLAEAPADSPLRLAHGRWPGGGGHTDTMRCDSCHSAWLPSCYGCHVEVELARPATSLLTGATTPGRVSSTPGVVATDSLVLMLDREGRIAPSMPAERVFFGARDGEGTVVFEDRVRTTADGSPGMGQRAFAPHTVRRAGPFTACARCHSSRGEVGDSLARVAAGFGSGRFTENDESGRTWQLDQVVDPDTLEATVAVGHEGSGRSGPLPAATIERMLGVRVE